MYFFNCDVIEVILIFLNFMYSKLPRKGSTWSDYVLWILLHDSSLYVPL